MAKKIIHTTAAPEAIGPYSQGVQAGDYVFYSGQIPLDPATGELVTGDISQQTEQILQNMGALLQAAGLDYTHVIKCHIYLTDMQDFSAVNEVYSRYFGEHQPARACIGVAALPKGAAVEMEWTAYTQA